MMQFIFKRLNLLYLAIVSPKSIFVLWVLAKHIQDLYFFVCNTEDRMLWITDFREKQRSD